MDALSRRRPLNNFVYLGSIQFLFFVVYFYLLFTGNSNFAYLLPALCINLFLYLLLFSQPKKILYFFFIALPLCGIGLFPRFYREIFIYFIPIFGLLFLGLTQFINQERWRLSMYPISGYLKILFCALVISLLYASLRGWYSLKLLRHSYLFVQSIILLILVMSLLHDKREILKSVYLFFFSSVAANLLFLIFGLFQGTLFARRVDLPFADFSLNTIALLFGPVIILGLSFLWLTDSSKKRFLIALSILIMVIALLITQSRGGWFAVLGGSIYLFTKKRFYRGVLLIAFFILILFSFELFRGLLTMRLEQIGGGDLALLHRVSLWQAAIRMIKENFLFGVGMNNFQIIKYQFGVPLWLDPIKAFNTHNLYLEILVNLGILGFLGFFGLIIKTFSRLSKIVTERSDRELTNLSLGLKGALFTFLLHGIIDCGLFFNVIFFSLMVLLGLSWTTIRLYELTYQKESAKVRKY